MVKYKKYLKKKKKKSQREQEGDFLAIPKQFSMIFCNHTKITFCNQRKHELMHTVGEKELKITSNTYVDQLRNVMNKVQEESPLLSLETL